MTFGVTLRLLKQKKPKVMLILNTTKLVEIFILCDDFMHSLEAHMAKSSLPSRGRSYSRKMSDSERMAILIFYHLSGVRCFKWYYQHIIQGHLSDYFPQTWSYSTFVEKMADLNLYLLILMSLRHRANHPTEANYVDSTRLAVCHNRRIKHHKVFKGLAKRGKTGVGWFFGFKLHLIINQLGQIVFVACTPGNIADNNIDLLKEMAECVNGYVYGDKGYITKIIDELREKGFQLFAKVRRNMKKPKLPRHHKENHRKRGLVECVIDFLKNICNVEHSRHRSPANFMTNLLAGICAYDFIDIKPGIIPSKAFFQPNQVVKI